MTQAMSDQIDVGTLGADTPSCSTVIHVNNTGASPIPDPVHHAMFSHLGLERRIGGHPVKATVRALVAARSIGRFTQISPRNWTAQ